MRGGRHVADTGGACEVGEGKEPSDEMAVSGADVDIMDPRFPGELCNVGTVNASWVLEALNSNSRRGKRAFESRFFRQKTNGIGIVWRTNGEKRSKGGLDSKHARVTANADESVNAYSQRRRLSQREGTNDPTGNGNNQRMNAKKL